MDRHQHGRGGGWGTGPGPRGSPCAWQHLARPGHQPQLPSPATTDAAIGIWPRPKTPKQTALPTWRPLEIMRLTALPPPPPTPMTLILASPPTGPYPPAPYEAHALTFRRSDRAQVGPVAKLALVPDREADNLAGAARCHGCSTRPGHTPPTCLICALFMVCMTAIKSCKQSK